MLETTLPKHILSKSTFIRGCQCPKSLHLYKTSPQIKGEISVQQQAIFTQGTNVGKLAEQLFPGGVDARPDSTYEYQKSVSKTMELIKSGVKIIYEAAFQYEGVMAAIDILVNEKGKWKAYEVKSSTEVKDVNLLDAALQYYVITNSGIPLVDISIVHINNKYVRKGDLDISQLFSIQSVKNEVLEHQKFVIAKIDELKSVVSSKKEPYSDIGPHCSDPYECDFMESCWSHIPDVSVFDLVRMKADQKFELYKKGIIDFKQIPNDFKLSDGQRIQVDTYLSNKSVIDKNAIKEFVGDLEYPIHFLDFETYQTAVPSFDDSRPYQQIPFQYSLHYKSESVSNALHYEFLAEANEKDPRLTLLEKLLHDTKNSKTILTYNKSFETGRLNEMAIMFPKYKKQIEDRISKVVDLMVPFQKRWYYVPAMNGSYSIKAVLPALIPNLNYDDLEIGEGGTASAAFVGLYTITDKQEINKIRNALLEYCKLDTFAMVKLLEHLENI